MELKIIEHHLSVCKVADVSDIDLKAEFYFIGKTDEELSLGTAACSGLRRIRGDNPGQARNRTLCFKSIKPKFRWSTQLPIHLDWQLFSASINVTEL